MKLELELDKDLVNDLKAFAKSRNTDLNTVITASLKAELIGSEVFFNEIYKNKEKQ